MSYWRTAGLSYLQYITVASSALRNTVKPQLQNKIWPREDISFRKQVWDRASGKPGEKTVIQYSKQLKTGEDKKE